MPTPEESNAAMRIIEKFQGEYEGGGVGLPPGADWVETAFAYMEHAGIYDDEAGARDLLAGYGVLVEAPPPPPPPPTFLEAMDIPDWWDSFRAFAATEFSTENPDFLDAVRFQTLDPQAIYDTYVKADAASQVNISDPKRRDLDAAFAGDDAPGYDVFDAATAEIRKMTSNDSWRRFLATQGG